MVLDIAAANRDSAVFADPDGFAPLRPDAGRHLTFGAGPRPCPGAAQARALACGVLDAALASRLPRTGAEPEWVARAAALVPEEAP
jgi:cytochrome P450